MVKGIQYNFYSNTATKTVAGEETTTVQLASDDQEAKDIVAGYPRRWLGILLMQELLTCARGIGSQGFKLPSQLANNLIDCWFCRY